MEMKSTLKHLKILGYTLYLILSSVAFFGSLSMVSQKNTIAFWVGVLLLILNTYAFILIIVKPLISKINEKVSL